MERGMFFNRTELNEWHPCYQVVNFSYARTSSIQCTLLYILLGFFSLVTVCGNVLVITSIGYFKQLHTPTNLLVLSLAVADVLVGLVVIPLTIYFTLTLCIYSPHWVCVFRDCCSAVIGGSSILHLCCIAIDRYYAVSKPLIYSAKINNRVAATMIFVCWSAATVAGVSIVTVISNPTCEGDCYTVNLIGTIFACLVTFYLPALVMIIIYLKILFVALKQARSIHNTDPGKTVSKMERKATKTLAIVMGVFLFCLTPHFTNIMIQVLSDTFVPLPLTEALVMIAFNNSMLNPFIYGVFYSWFRCAFKMILTGKIFQGDFTSAKLL